MPYSYITSLTNPGHISDIHHELANGVAAGIKISQGHCKEEEEEPIRDEVWASKDVYNEQMNRDKWSPGQPQLKLDNANNNNHDLEITERQAKSGMDKLTKKLSSIGSREVLNLNSVEEC